MSTFLELVNDLKREAGASGAALTTVSGQSGENQRLIEWVLSAYQKVQNLHTNWNFLRADFTLTLADGDNSYSKTDASAHELARWKTDSFKLYLASVTDEQELDYLAWDDFRAHYMRGGLHLQESRPQVFTVKTDNTLVFDYTPNAAYTVTGEYWKRAQALSADSDEPLIPVQFQDVIVYRALMFYGAHTGAAERYEHGETEYKKLLRDLERDQLPDLAHGLAMPGPLL